MTGLDTLVTERNAPKAVYYASIDRSKAAVMLTLYRRIGEKVLIGDDILVEVLEISGELVRLGVAAPKDVKILQDELLEEEGGDFRWTAVRPTG